MPKIDITKTELVWPGKYNEDGTLKEVPRVNLPFQVIETVNESRATREAKKGGVQGSLFDFYEGKEGETFEEGWKNKLIWGDNLLVMGSLLEKFAGKIDLIYIDPPFATGSDFTFVTEIGDGSIRLDKEASVVEEKAYRDTWGRGLISYMQMMRERLTLIRSLMSQKGNLIVHVAPSVSPYLRLLLGNCSPDLGSRMTNSWGTKRSARTEPKKRRPRCVLDIIAPRRYVAAPIQAVGVQPVGYFGSKATSGLCQPLIAMVPPHDTYIETHLGGGAIMKRKPAALRNIGIDRDARALDAFECDYPVELVHGCAHQYLAEFEFQGSELVYSDPPYLKRTRTSRRRYRFDYEEADHVALLELLKGVPCQVMVSGYPSTLYEERLRGWRSVEWQVMNQGGVRTEKLWFNFAPERLHWARYAGKNFTDRQRIKRKAQSWGRRYAALPVGERLAVLGAMMAVEAER